MSRGRPPLDTRSVREVARPGRIIIRSLRWRTSKMAFNPRLVKESFAVIEPVAGKAAAYFYGRLFAENPHLRGMFPPAMDHQRDRLFGALTRVVWSLDSPDSLASYLGQLGRDHRKYGVAGDHYTAVGNALLATVRRFAADVWTPEIEAAWVTAYGAAA